MRLVRVLCWSMIAALPLIAADHDPFLGKWKLDWANSHSPDPAPKSAIRIYTKSGAGVKVSEDWIGADGNHTRLEYTANYDGRDYPVPTRKGATVAFQRTGPFRVEGVSKADGKVEYTFKRTVSQDGRTLTIETSRIGPGGKPATEVLVYRKM